MALATLTSPIAGKVMSVGLAAGTSVAAGSSTETTSATASDSSAASTTAQFVVEDTSGYSVVGTVPATSIGHLQVGNPATIVATSSAQQLAGVVTTINRIPTTTNGTADFTVAIAISTPGITLYSGTNASATITVQHRKDVMEVPTSALHTSGQITTVDVFDTTEGASGDKVTRTVKLGAVGSTSAEVISGLKLGDRVILAQIDAAIPTTTSAVGNGLGGGGGLTGTGRTNFPSAARAGSPSGN